MAESSKIPDDTVEFIVELCRSHDLTAGELRSVRAALTKSSLDEVFDRLCHRSGEHVDVSEKVQQLEAEIGACTGQQLARLEATIHGLDWMWRPRARTPLRPRRPTVDHQASCRWVPYQSIGLVFPIRQTPCAPSAG